MGRLSCSTDLMLQLPQEDSQSEMPIGAAQLHATLRLAVFILAAAAAALCWCSATIATFKHQH